MSDRSLLADGAAVWSDLRKRAGFDDEYYDAATVVSLRSELGLPSTGDLRQQLRERGVTTEEFIPAFFRAAEPYVRMMSDLLRMFEDVAATRGDQQMDVRYDFGKGAAPLAFDLEQFRQWASHMEQAVALVQVELWSHDTLWSLAGAVRGKGYQCPGPLGPDHVPRLLRNTRAEQWLRTYYEGRRWPDWALEAPTCGERELDDLLRRAWLVWAEVVRQSRRWGAERQRLRQEVEVDDAAGAEQTTSGWPRRLLVNIDSDFWAGSFVRDAHGRAALLRTARDTLSPEAGHRMHEWREELETVLSSVPSAERERLSLVERLTAFLSLPVWQRRHELYAAWITTQIREAVGPERLRMHVADGRLSWAFSGSHLGTLAATEPAVHLWAELRSPLTNPMGWGRKRAIQPDYTLVHDPLTDPGSALVVVECKQYRRASTRNFVAALVDYARGRPAAHVVLVNYGPAREDITGHVPEDLRHRTHVIGGMRPLSPDAQGRFHTLLRALLSARMRGHTTSQPVANLTQDVTDWTIALTWGGQPRDLDLHVYSETDAGARHVHYFDRGELGGPPWVALDDDCRAGHGPESVRFARRFVEGRYRIAVHNYSGEVLLSVSGAALAFDLGGAPWKLAVPTRGQGRWWHAADIDGAMGDVTVVNEIRDEAPWG